jgi:tyrosinase
MPLDVRRNQSALSRPEKERIVNAILDMKRTPLLPGTTDTHSRPDDPKNIYDKYVQWHIDGMSYHQLAGSPAVNLIHGNPLFLPWHRYMTRLFELDLQQADIRLHAGGEPGTSTPIGKITLPYWDFCIDTSRDPSVSGLGSMWTAFFMGGFPAVPVSAGLSYGFVTDGPFALRAGSTNPWPVYLDQIPADITPSGLPVTPFPDQRLTRALATDRFALSDLPYARQTVGELPLPSPGGQINRYDSAPWDESVFPNLSFRNAVEGGSNNPALPNTSIGGAGGVPRLQMHNRAHPFIGGHSSVVPISVNDPAFFLLHANVDRYWVMWQLRNRSSSSASYPQPSQFTALGARARDYMFPWDSSPALRKRPTEVWNHRRLGYCYDFELSQLTLSR